MKILVTGGTVFASRFTAEYFVNKGHEVYVLNRGIRPQPDGVIPIIADRHSLDEKLRELEFEAVLDITAYNADDVSDLLDGLGAFGTYIMISSSAVYPETLTQPFTEEMPCGANRWWGVYGTNKLAAEKILFERVPQAYVLRPPYLCGAMNNLYREAFAFDCAEQGLPIYLPQNGLLPLQFFDIEDICRFIEILIKEKPRNHIFNVGNADVVSAEEWTKICYSVLGAEPDIRYASDDINVWEYFPFRNYAYMLDVSKMRELMSDTKPLYESIAQSYEWYKNNRELVVKKGYLDHIRNTLLKTKVDYFLEETEMTVFEELKRRGLLAQLTDEEEIKELINAGKATFYIGFDPTADSLHVGHFMALCLMKRLQMAGNKPIALLGGGTGMIGDPSGKTDMRKMLTREDIEHNVECFKKQMSRFIDFSDGKAMVVNNADWLLNLNYVDVLREVGAHFSVNKMLTFECYKQRMERGLTFLEFNYMIMQSYDFYKLFCDYGCNMQFGGDDQWANMLGGTELIRKKLGKDAYAMTITLLLNSEGKKMGKTEKGAVWLDPEKTSPYDFFQYWRNVADADVIKCLKMLTFVPIEEIEEMEKTMEGAQFNKAKELLAYELTKLVHGADEADKALAAAKAIFGAGSDSADMPTTAIPLSELDDGKIGILNILVQAKLAASNSEGRRLVQQGGISVNDEKITDPSAKIEIGDGVIVKKGKKVFHKVVTE